jgi:hypothetical protein
VIVVPGLHERPSDKSHHSCVAQQLARYVGVGSERVTRQYTCAVENRGRRVSGFSQPAEENTGGVARGAERARLTDESFAT